MNVRLSRRSVSGNVSPNPHFIAVLGDYHCEPLHVAALKLVAAKRLREIVEEAFKADAAESSEARKIGDYFASYIDDARIEKLGAALLKGQLDAIGRISTRKDLATALGEQVRSDVNVLNIGQF